MKDVLDRNELLEHMDGDLDFLAETVEMLHEDGPALLEELVDAVTKKDNSALRKAAHTFKCKRR